MLRRFSSKRLDRLAIEVGWRRGDAASLMADSAGGKTIALLSTCLANIFAPDSVGLILDMLCNRCLPNDMCIVSIAQLRDVAMLLASKLYALGFGNHLAQQVVKIHSVYDNLGLGTQDGLLSCLTAEAMVDLIRCLMQVLSDNDKVARVTGFIGMGYVVGLVLFMFPEDTLLTVDSFVVHEGPRRSILLELTSASADPIRIRIETDLQLDPVVRLPLAEVITFPSYPALTDCEYTKFAWKGWVANALQLSFSRFGVACTQEFLDAFSNLLVALAPEIGPQRAVPSAPEGNDTLALKLPPRQRDGIHAMLGEFPWERMQRICQDVLLASPSAHGMDPEKGFSVLASILERITKQLKCECEGERCQYIYGWAMESYPRPRPRVASSTLGNTRSKRYNLPDCPRQNLWISIRQCIADGLCCFLIDAGPNVSVRPDDVRLFILEFITVLDGQHSKLTTQLLEALITERTYFVREEQSLAGSFGYATIFPTALKTMRFPLSMLRTFELVEGGLHMNGREYQRLVSDSMTPRSLESLSLYDGHLYGDTEPIIPSSRGTHSALRLTVTEETHRLKLTLSARYDGKEILIPLSEAIAGCYGLMFATDPCNHPPSTPLNESYISETIATGIGATRWLASQWRFSRSMGFLPNSELALCSLGWKGSIGLIMVESSPVGQLLACNYPIPGLVIRDCCLNCAVEQAKKNQIRMIIVT
jgi:hypothetical protein